MKIKIDEVPERGLHLRWDEPPAALDERVRADAADAGTGIPAARSPIHADLTAARAGRAVAVVGRLRAGLDLECARCLVAVETALDLPVSLLFVPTRPTVDPQDDPLGSLDLSGLPFTLPGEELELLDYAGQEIDLSQAVVDQVVLALPIQPLCREACRGLCAACGQDLNAGRCDCGSDPVDPRFAALKNLKLGR
jgi:uncharacterized protein